MASAERHRSRANSPLPPPYSLPRRPLLRLFRKMKVAFPPHRIGSGAGGFVGRIGVCMRAGAHAGDRQRTWRLCPTCPAALVLGRLSAVAPAFASFRQWRLLIYNRVRIFFRIYMAMHLTNNIKRCIILPKIQPAGFAGMVSVFQFSSAGANMQACRHDRRSGRRRYFFMVKKHFAGDEKSTAEAVQLDVKLYPKEDEKCRTPIQMELLLTPTIRE